MHNNKTVLKCKQRYISLFSVMSLLIFLGGFTADFASAFSSQTEEQKATGTGPGKCARVLANVV